MYNSSSEPDPDNHTRWATYAVASLRDGTQPLTFEAWLNDQVDRVPDSVEDLYPGFLAYTRTLGASNA